MNRFEYAGERIMKRRNYLREYGHCIVCRLNYGNGTGLLEAKVRKEYFHRFFNEPAATLAMALINVEERGIWKSNGNPIHKPEDDYSCIPLVLKSDS